MKTSPPPIAILCALTFSNVALAAKIDEKIENNFDVGLNASTLYTDNALQSSSDIFGERQDVVGAVMGGSYLNDWGQANAHYQTSSYTFEKKSQHDQSLTSGGASLLLGSSSEPFSVLFGHSRSVILISPELLDLVNNRDERDVFNVRPMAKLRLGTGDALQVTGDFSSANYRFEPNKKTESKGAGLVWQHLMSAASNLELTAKQDATTFEKVPDNNFTLQNINAKYAVKLNRLDYSVTIGGNNIPAKGEKESFFRPLYSLESSYIDGYNTFKLLFDQKIINGALGNVADLGLGSAPVSTGANGIGFINARTYQLVWITRAICERCEFKTDLYQTNKEFRVTSENQSDVGGRVSFNYKFTKNVSFTTSVDYSKRDLSGLNASRSFNLTQYDTGVSWAIYNDFSIKAYTRKVHRESVSLTDGFYEQITGLTLNYSFKK